MGFFRKLVGTKVDERAQANAEHQERVDRKQRQELKRRLALLQTEVDVLRRASE